MAKSESEKDKSKDKAKEKPKDKGAGQAGSDAGKKAKAKPAADAAAKEEAIPQEKAPPAPRQPADPRLKYLKKFHGKFLPRGPLRDRHTALMSRWNSGEDHGGVTAEELKALYDDWRADRAGRRRPAATSA